MPARRASASARILPFDLNVEAKGYLGNVLKHRPPPAPPSYRDLEAAGLVAPEDDADRWFRPEERLTARWLRSRGLDVLSVQRREGQHLKTPDAVASGFAITVETKSAVATTNAVVQRIRAARWQARHVVVDIRGARATPAIAEAGLQSAVRMYGALLDEVVVVVSDDLGLGWWRG